MDKIIFFGDSITEQFDLLKMNKSVINFGVGGDTTIKLIGRVKEVIVEEPSKLFILIGINDYLLNQNFYDEKLIIDFKLSFKTLIKHIKDNLNDTKLYLISILPVVNLVSKDEVIRLNKEIDELNEFIKLICKEYNAEYINIAKELKNPDNNLIEDYTKDGLHLNNLGYEVYYELISKYF